MSHLTDEQIQEYLDNKTVKNTTCLTEHLKSCAFCRQQIEAYKQLFSSLNVEPDFTLPFDLIDNVVSTIETGEDKKYKKWESILLIFSIFQGIGLAIYFFDFKKLFSVFSFDFFNFLKSTVEQISGTGNGFLPILIFALIILMFFGFLDRFINQLKHQSS